MYVFWIFSTFEFGAAVKLSRQCFSHWCVLKEFVPVPLFCCVWALLSDYASYLCEISCILSYTSTFVLLFDENS